MNVITRHNINISGRGTQPLIFLHGLGCNQNMWRLIKPALEDEFRIVLVDLVGAGDSDTSAYDFVKYSTLHGHADDLLEICDHLQLNNVIVIAHSVSCMITLLAAIKKPTLFDRLILIGPSPCYANDKDYYGGFNHQELEELLDSMESNFNSWVENLAPVIMGKLDRQDLAEELVLSFCSSKPDIVKHFSQLTFLSDNRKDLPKVQTPSLILQCSNDVIAPESVGAFLLKNLKGSTFVKLQAEGHCPHLSAPEETIVEIRHFLNRPKQKRELINTTHG